MANKVLKLNKLQVLALHFRLSQTQLGGGRLAQIIVFMRRLLKVWHELAHGESEAIAAAIPLEEVRDVMFTAEEQTAVADGLIRLLNSDKILNNVGEQVSNTVGIKEQILKDAGILGWEIERHIMKRLSSEAVLAFVPDIDGDEDTDITAVKDPNAEEPAPPEITKLA